MTEPSLSRLRQQQIPRGLPTQTLRHALNENVLPDLSRDNDSPNVPTPAKQPCLYQTTQADLLSRSRSWSQQLTRRGRHGDQKASRKESRRMRRCRNADQLHAPSVVQVTCTRLFPSRRQDLCQRAESEHLSGPGYHLFALASRVRSRESSRGHHW